MKRIDIHYGGERYSVGQRSFDDILDEVRAALAAGHGWLTVNDGDGARREAYLLIAPGVPLAIVPIPVVEGDDPPADISDTLVPS